MSLLVKEEIIPAKDANSMSMHDYISPSTLLTYLQPVYALQSCRFLEDYDGDGIPNTRDICLHTYDPAQYDADADGL